VTDWISHQVSVNTFNVYNAITIHCRPAFTGILKVHKACFLSYFFHQTYHILLLALF